VHPPEENEPDVHLTILDRLDVRRAGPPPRRTRCRASILRRKATLLRRGVRDRAGAIRGAASAGSARIGLAAGALRSALAAMLTWTAVLARRVLRITAYGAGALRSALAAMLAWTAVLARRVLRITAYASALALLVVLAGLGWRGAVSISANRPPPDPPVEAEVPPATILPRIDQRPAALREAGATLDDASATEEAKLAAVETVARDPDNTATEILLSGVDDPSVVVSMASIRALRGRPCGRIAAPLLQRLASGDWQHRAWAAKVLGENACTITAPALTRRLAGERDARVRRQITTALAMLGGPAS
jgi:hypothetical protein